jgi:hypothetical protein
MTGDDLRPSPYGPTSSRPGRRERHGHTAQTKVDPQKICRKIFADRHRGFFPPLGRKSGKNSPHGHVARVTNANRDLDPYTSRVHPVVPKGYRLGRRASDLGC